MHAGPEPVDREAVKELFFRAAATRKVAILFSTAGFSRLAARWAAAADVGLVATSAGCSPKPDPRAGVLAMQSDEGWRRLLVSLLHLPRAGSVEGVALAADSSWRIVRLGWREYQLDTDPDGAAPNLRPVRNLRGRPESVVDALRTMLTGPLEDLARFSPAVIGSRCFPRRWCGIAGAGIPGVTTRGADRS